MVDVSFLKSDDHFINTGPSKNSNETDEEKCKTPGFAQYDETSVIKFELINKAIIYLSLPKLNPCVEKFEILSKLPEELRFDSVRRQFITDVCKINNT
jgi:hypothetical protein